MGGNDHSKAIKKQTQLPTPSVAVIQPTPTPTPTNDQSDIY